MGYNLTRQKVEEYSRILHQIDEHVVQNGGQLTIPITSGPSELTRTAFALNEALKSAACFPEYNLSHLRELVRLSVSPATCSITVHARGRTPSRAVPTSMADASARSFTSESDILGHIARSAGEYILTIKSDTVADWAKLSSAASALRSTLTKLDTLANGDVVVKVLTTPPTQPDTAMAEFNEDDIAAELGGN
jgi:hypothetical protein